MKTFVKVVGLVLLAVIALKLLPITFAFLGLLAGAAAAMIAFGVSMIAIVFGLGVTAAAILSPIWIPVLVIVAIVALVRRATRPARPVSA